MMICFLMQVFDMSTGVKLEYALNSTAISLQLNTWTSGSAAHGCSYQVHSNNHNNCRHDSSGTGICCVLLGTLACSIW